MCPDIFAAKNGNMEMEQVTLVFTDERDLRRFQAIVDSEYSKLNARDLTITCTCSKEDIELAKKAFRARVVDIKN